MLSLWLAAALATTLLFASGRLDIAVARWFYRPAAAEHWPLAHELPWSLLYRAASGLTAALVLAALVALAASVAPARHHWRRAAVLLLLAVAIGPGLLGNALLKDHWQHPRPRDVAELGGTLAYVPAPLIGRQGGASFPCGHCTVGFLYGAGWWLWRARRPRTAVASLLVGLTLGVLLGVGRMAAGAHFLSDIVWSALLAFGVLHLLHVWAAQRVPRLLMLAAIGGAVVVLAALLAAPHGMPLAARLPLTSLSAMPRVLEVTADTANIEIVLRDDAGGELSIAGELHGFGLPGSRLEARLELSATPPPARLRYTIEQRGWLTDVDGAATLQVPAAAFETIIVRVRRGEVRVVDATRAGSVAAGNVRLELHTGHGHVQVTRMPGAAAAAGARSAAGS